MTRGCINKGTIVDIKVKKQIKIIDVHSRAKPTKSKAKINYNYISQTSLSLRNPTSTLMNMGKMSAKVEIENA